MSLQSPRDEFAHSSSRFGKLDFGLTESEEMRAKSLHDSALIIDLMFQGPCSYLSLEGGLLEAEKQRWQETGSGEVFTDCMLRVIELAGRGELPDYETVWKKSGLTGTNLQVIGGDIRDGAHLSRLKEFAAHDWYRQAKGVADFHAAKTAGRHVSFLNYQYIPESVADLDWFDEAAEVGLRMMGLTYNHPNQFGAGCTSPDPGLSAFGRDAVRRMNEAGIIVDISHAGRMTTLDACRFSTEPVIASHAGAEAVFMHPRNKSDDELRAIADTGGLCGVFAAPVLLSPDLPGHIDLMFDHIDYLVDLIGIDCVALGTDWPLQLPKWVLEVGGPFKQWTRDMGFRDEDLERPDLNLVGFDDYRDYPNITRGLVKRGYADDDIRKILGDNALRVIDAVWK